MQTALPLFHHRTFRLPDRPSSFEGVQVARRISEVPVPGLRRVIVSFRGIKFLNRQDLSVIRALEFKLRSRSVQLQLSELSRETFRTLHAAGLAYLSVQKCA